MNILYSYHYWRRAKQGFAATIRQQREAISGDLTILLDSGAYSAWSQGVKVDIDEYAQWLGPLVDRGLVQHYINLDVMRDPVLSEKNQHHLETKYGLRPIPVFHVGSDWKYLHRMCERYPYVCIGGMVAARSPGKVRAWAIEAHRIAAEHGARLHGLGQTSTKMLELPWYSADSSTWSMGGRYGVINVYDPDARALVKVKLSKKNPDLRELYRLAPILRDLGLDPGLVGEPGKGYREGYYWDLLHAATTLSWLEWESSLRRRARRTMGEAWDGRPRFYYVLWPWQGPHFAKLWQRWTDLRGDGMEEGKWRPVLA